MAILFIANVRMFQQFLTQPDIARDFMEAHLPPELRAVCDLSTLKLESG